MQGSSQVVPIMPRAAIGVIVALALTACATPETATMWRTLDGKAPLIIAHRGASGYLPEHTLEAYALAIDQGADVIEPDLVFTGDGVLVARHDRYLSTTTNVADKPEFASRKRANADPNDDAREDWWVEDFTLAEIKTLRARQPFAGRSKEDDDKFDIPAFAEMLALVARKSSEAGRPIGVYPETKHPSFYTAIGHDFEAPLLNALEGFNAGPVFIQSFEAEILKRLKGKTDAKLVQLVFEAAPGAGPNIALEEIATYADGVGPEKDLATGGRRAPTTFVERAHSLGLLVHPWTFRDDRTNPAFARSAVDNKSSALDGAGFVVTGVALETDWESLGVPNASGDELRSYLWFRGADGVFTDFPQSAVKVRRRLEAPVERQAPETTGTP